MDIPEDLDNLINKSIDEAYSLINPRGRIKTLKIDNISNGRVSFVNSCLIINSEDIINLLRYSDYATVMAVTIGDKLPIHIDELFKEDEYAEALIFDAIGSEGAEKTADELNQLVEKEALDKGYFLTERFSPGYGDFELSFQPQVINELETKEIGLCVTETNILIPRKSVTAIIGWTRKKEKSTTEIKCRGCNLSGCQYRRADHCTFGN